MSDLKELLAGNKRWAEKIKASDPEFFNSLSAQQTPHYMWIGCSDSRVPSTQLVGLDPGEMFVHRNVANLVVHTDFNCLSVLQYAVEVLKVSHVIVCGHYNCGGIKAAMENHHSGLIDNWLRHVQDVMRSRESELSAIKDAAQRLDKLCELNVIEQVLNVSRTTIVQNAWNRGQDLAVHGLIYQVGDGLLRDLNICITSESQLATAAASI
ncbi:MAG TPA: carbonate dehydratase [Pyrinomonadaceae bacterium]